MRPSRAQGPCTLNLVVLAIFLVAEATSLTVDKEVAETPRKGETAGSKDASGFAAPTDSSRTADFATKDIRKAAAGREVATKSDLLGLDSTPTTPVATRDLGELQRSTATPLAADPGAALENSTPSLLEIVVEESTDAGDQDGGDETATDGGGTAAPAHSSTLDKVVKSEQVEDVHLNEVLDEDKPVKNTKLLKASHFIPAAAPEAPSGPAMDTSTAPPSSPHASLPSSPPTSPQSAPLSSPTSSSSSSPPSYPTSTPESSPSSPPSSLSPSSPSSPPPSLTPYLSSSPPPPSTPPPSSSPPPSPTPSSYSSLLPSSTPSPSSSPPPSSTPSPSSSPPPSSTPSPSSSPPPSSTPSPSSSPPPSPTSSPSSSPPPPTPSPSPSTTPVSDAEPTPSQLDPYRNWDSDSQERERELEERAREQNHPADDIEDSHVHEVNHFVPEDLEEDVAASGTTLEAGTRSVARWYLLLLAGNSTTVRLRQKDFAKYLKLNLAARLSVEYNDLRVNRVEFKPLLMVNVTIFSRPKDNEEVPLHMLADTNATLLELSGEEYHVVRFITIPSEHQEALASGFQSDSYSSVVASSTRHVDMGVAVYFAIAAALGSILLAVFLVGLCRYVRGVAAELSWRPWRRYKPIVFPRWSLPGLPLQHRLYADHIAQCAPLGREPNQAAVWTTSDEVPVQKILAPDPPRRLVFTPEPGKAHLVECRPPPVLEPARDPAPSTADTLLQQVGPAPRPNSKLSLFGSQETVVQPDRAPLGRPASSRKRLQPQGRHPLDVRIGTVLGLDNPNYMLQ